MLNGHKVVVTFTSWKKRIGNCAQVVQGILKNTVQPDIIYLNLSEAEFPGKSKDLPSSLVQLEKDISIFQINWVPGPNTKSMKKVFPILQHLNADDMIITCDDDFVIPNDFVKIRTTEFIEHGCNCAISSSNKPEWHHRTIYGQKYWGIGSGSIFSRKMFNNYERILDQNIIKTYNDDVVYALIVLSNGFWIEPTKVLSNQSGIGPRKIAYMLDDVGMTRQKMYEMNMQHILDAFEKRFNLVYPQTSLKKKITQTIKLHSMNLVVIDSAYKAGDNGEYFYRAVRELYPSIEMVFLIDETCGDYKRLKSDGFKVLPFSKSQQAFQKANFILISKDLGGNHPAQKILAGYRSKCIFLGHGVTSVLSNDSSYIKGVIGYIAKFMCCTSDEEARLIKKYSDGRLFPISCGFPRHDFLLRKHIQRKNKGNSRKCIFISFHFRNTLGGTYLRDINTLLNSDGIKKLHESGVRIVFLPHAMFMNKVKMFKVPKYVEVPINAQFQDLLVESDILVTDVSSNNFEMAYMDKPTIMFIPGYDRIKLDRPHYCIEKHRQFSHIFFCKNQNEVFSKANELLSVKSGTFKFSKKLFKYVDANNSRRLIEWMLERKQTDKNTAPSKCPPRQLKQLRFQFC